MSTCAALDLSLPDKLTSWIALHDLTTDLKGVWPQPVKLPCLLEALQCLFWRCLTEAQNLEASLFSERSIYVTTNKKEKEIILQNTNL